MARYHVNNSGDVGTCKAAKDGCPFGSADEHFTDKEEAQKASEKYMESQYGLINSIYKKGAQDTSALDGMDQKLKNKIIKDSASGENRMHPSVVGKVFARDNDELVRRKVAENMKSQNIIRKMSDDESAKVRANVAASTNNPEVLKKLSQDADSKVRNAALKNERMPKRAKKQTLAKLKEQSAKARASKDSDIDVSDPSHFENADKSSIQTTLKPETLKKIRDNGRPYHTYKGFNESERPLPGVQGDYHLAPAGNGRHRVSYYSDLNDSSYTTSKTFESEQEAREFATSNEGLGASQKPYSERETEKINRQHEAYMRSRARSNYTGD